MNADTPYDVLFEEYASEMNERTARGEILELRIPLSAAISTLAMLQLAFRSATPYENGTREALSVAQLIQQTACTTPAIAETIRRGWLEQYDVVHHARVH